jgi:dTDP-4-dehydrorhamnose reductase
MGQWMRARVRLAEYGQNVLSIFCMVCIECNEGRNIACKTTPEFYSAVQRPAYSVLSKAKLGGLGLGMPIWQEGLARYLSARTPQA